MPVDTTTQTDSHRAPRGGAPRTRERRDTADAPTDTPAADLGPAGRIRLRETERAILRARVVALERAIQRRDRQLQTVIEQYEAILDGRDDVPANAMSTGDGTDADGTGADDGGVLQRVRATLAGLF